MKKKHFVKPPTTEFILVKGDNSSSIKFADACLFSSFRLLIQQAKYIVREDLDGIKSYEIDIERFGVEIHTIHLICDVIRKRPIQDA
jgi:hypothetical protein